VTWYLSTGRGQGQSLIKNIELSAGRRLHPLPPGRPKADNDRGTIATDDQLALEMDV